MKIKNILFVMSFLYSLSIASFSLPDFLRTPDAPKKSALYKMGVGAALFSASIVDYDSIPVDIAQVTFGFAGILIGISGACQLLTELCIDQEEKKSLQLDTPRYNRFIHILAHDDRFLGGAALSAGGLVLAMASQKSSSSSLACTVLGMALMGWATHEPVKKEIKDFINK